MQLKFAGKAVPWSRSSGRGSNPFYYNHDRVYFLDRVDHQQICFVLSCGYLIKETWKKLSAGSIRQNILAQHEFPTLKKLQLLLILVKLQS